MDESVSRPPGFGSAFWRIQPLPGEKQVQEAKGDKRDKYSIGPKPTQGENKW
tara:strand:+ start:222 stop:377 length:156 start_codon:yes stop_codon:yes gene_type:complete